MIEMKPLPPARTLLGAIDTQARRSLELAAADIRPIVQDNTPGRGLLERQMEPKVAATRTGAALRVGPTRGTKHRKVTTAQVVRWLTRGTGEFRVGGGPKGPIIAKGRRPMRLPGGLERWSVRGQHPNPFGERIERLAAPRVERQCVLGAQEAGKRVEALIR